MQEISLVAVAIHILAATVWVGGMFFAYQVLRPSLGSFEPPQRLTLWKEVFSRFFFWVWIAIIALPATGYWLLFNYFDGFGSAGLHIHIMHLLGLVMIALFLYLYFVTYRHYSSAVAAKNWPLAGQHLNTIRRIVGTNTLIGLITVVIGASGKLWS